MGLNRLPDELKILVFEQVYNDEDKKTSPKSNLAAVVLCCRRFYDLVIPILYREYDGKKPMAFLSTILKRPDLALHVNKMTGLHRYEGQLEYEDDVSLYPRRPVLKNVANALEKALEDRFDDSLSRSRLRNALFYPEGERFTQRDNWDVITALLMVLLPNITTLILPFYVDSTDVVLLPEFIDQVFARTIEFQNSNEASPYPLKKLRTFDVRLEDSGGTALAPFDTTAEDWEYQNTILPFLKLRSLRHVIISNSHVGKPPKREIMGDVMPHITHLSFGPDPNINSEAMARFLMAFCGLTHFSFIRRADDGCQYEFIPPAIRRGLLCSKNSLREITIIAEHTGFHEDRFMPALGCLLEFRQLCRLDGSVNALLGSDYDNVENGLQADGAPHVLADIYDRRFVHGLPDSLEELVLRFCDVAILNMMQVLFERRREGGLRGLKKVALFLDLAWNAEESLQDDLGELGKACELEAKDLGILMSRYTDN